MNATLFSEIQRLFERTYATVGINLEDCLIDGPRCGQLSRAAGASARELSELARTFLRNVDGRSARRHLLFALADRTTRTPRPSQGSQRHEHPFADRVRRGDRPRAARFALAFQRGRRAIGSEEFARNLELQAQVDTYLVLLMFVAFFRRTQKVSRTDRRWLRFHLFARHDTQAYRDPNLRGRYLETTQLAKRYTRYLDTAQRIAAAGGDPCLSRARLSMAKKERILALPAPPARRRSEGRPRRLFCSHGACGKVACPDK